MKQKLCIVMIMLILGSVCNRVSAESKVDWGMKLGLDVDLPGKWKGENGSVTMFRPGIGFNIGGVANIYLGKKFYFQPGLSYFYSGYKFKDLVISGAGGSFGDETDPKVSKYGVQIPLLIGYQIDFSERFGLDVYTGPQMRYAFAGKIGIKNKALKEELADSFNLWNTQRRFDLSWKIGIGFPIRDCMLSVEADLGLTDLLKADLSFRENRIGIGFIKFF